MNARRWICPSLGLLLAVLFAFPQQVEANAKVAKKRERAPQPLQESEVAATVLSLRRLQSGTYLEVVRDDGTSEWLDIGTDEGMQVRAGQRVVYSLRSRVYQNTAFGSLRTGVNFRVVTGVADNRTYRSEASDGTAVFTDNPAPGAKPKKSGQAASKAKQKAAAKGAKKTPEVEVIIVDLDQVKKLEELKEAISRYSEEDSQVPQASARRAKRAKVPQPER